VICAEQTLIGHSGDKKVLDALEVMNSEGVSSLAVVDSQYNVVGNISTTDVKVCSEASVLDDALMELNLVPY